MIRILLSLLLTICLADRLNAQSPQEPGEPAKVASAAKSVEAKWAQLVGNKAYLLHELKLSKTSSLLHGTYFELDAQMGIAIAIELCVVADKKDFKYVRFIRPEPADDGLVLKTLKHEEELSVLIPDEYKATDLFLVEFLNEKPDSAEHVFNASVMASLAKKSRTRKSKPDSKRIKRDTKEQD